MERDLLDSTEGLARIARLTEKINSQVDAVLCTSPENIYFFSGFRTMLYTRFTAVLMRMDQRRGGVASPWEGERTDASSRITIPSLPSTQSRDDASQPLLIAASIDRRMI